MIVKKKRTIIIIVVSDVKQEVRYEINQSNENKNNTEECRFYIIVGDYLDCHHYASTI